jgi:hypothetical protein
MKHADVFGSLYIMSPCCLSARGVGRDPAGSRRRSRQRRRRRILPNSRSSRAQLAAAVLVAQSEESAVYLDLATKDGAPRPEVLARWAANAPLAFVDQYIGELRTYKAIAMDVGDQDGLRSKSWLPAILETRWERGP